MAQCRLYEPPLATSPRLVRSRPQGRLRPPPGDELTPREGRPGGPPPRTAARRPRCAGERPGAERERRAAGSGARPPPRVREPRRRPPLASAAARDPRGVGPANGRDPARGGPGVPVRLRPAGAHRVPAQGREDGDAAGRGRSGGAELPDRDSPPPARGSAARGGERGRKLGPP